MPSRSSSRRKILSVCRDLFQVSQTQAKHLQTSEAQTKQGQAIVLKACSHLKLHIKSVSQFKPLHAARAQGADFSPSEICKATLSVKVGRKTKTMKTVQQSPREIAYRRDDGDRFRYRCKLESERVIWRTSLSDTSEWDRWGLLRSLHVCRCTPVT